MIKNRLSGRVDNDEPNLINKKYTLAEKQNKFIYKSISNI